MLTLSVLDQSPIASGATPSDAVANTLDLAGLCDRLGYRRYWLAEHHSTESLAGSAPEILIGPVAAATRRLRVGSGGVMLSHYSPLKVAEQFRMLETLFPGRIDLGIGRAPGSDQHTARALAAGPGTAGIDLFPNQIQDLIAYLHDDLPGDHPFRGVQAMPTGSTAPDLWLLGSSDQSAAYAAHFGAAFCFAHFINAEGGEAVMEAYRRHFRPSPHLARPAGSVAVFAIVGETPEQAEYLAASRDLFLLRFFVTGNPGPYPSPEEALAYPYSDRDRAIVAHNRRRGIVGDAPQVKARIEAIAAAHGVDEVVVVTICHDHQARRRSYELLAGAFGLKAAP
jgi:luciferase family oxidoreductase group 1